MKIRRATIVANLFIYLLLFLACSTTFCLEMQINLLFTILLELKHLWLPERTVSSFLSVRKGFADSTYKRLDMQSPYSTYSFP